MTVPKRLEEAASRLEEARWRVDLARKKALSQETLREWLEALTDVALALSDIEQANNESVHEKLHQLAGRVGMPGFGAKRGAGRRQGATTSRPAPR